MNMLCSYLLLSLISCAGATTPAAVDPAILAPAKTPTIVHSKDIKFTWTDTFATVPACTKKITTGCVTAFVLSEPVSGFTTTVNVVGSPNSYKLTTLPPPGIYTYSLIAVTTNGSKSLPSTFIAEVK